MLDSTYGSLEAGQIVVLRFGHSDLESSSDLCSAASECYGWIRRGHKVVAVAPECADSGDNLAKALSTAGMRSHGVGVSRDAGLRSLLSTHDVVVVHRQNSQKRRLRVTILGLGTVGGGVFDRLSSHPNDFEIVSSAALHPQKHPLVSLAGVPIETDAFAALESDCDVVVEAIGGLSPAHELMRHALETGRHVVTANKAVIASHPELEELAARRRLKLLLNASVGGACPMIERVEQSALAGIRELRGVVNGTSNFVLDRIIQGYDMGAAVGKAIELGLAEADPSGDIDGLDAAYKMTILAAKAFGIRYEPKEIRRQKLSDFNDTQIRENARNGLVLRQVANATRNGASVSYQFLPESDPLSAPRGAENVLAITKVDGSNDLVRGVGAGRYPTTEAVFADLCDIHRHLAKDQQQSELFATA